MAYEVKVGDSTIVVEEEDGAFVAQTDKCLEEVRKVINAMFYGVEVLKDGDKMYFIPTEKSGVREEYKPLFYEVLPKEEVDKNQISAIVLVLGIALSIVGICQVWPDAPLCKGLSQYSWNVVFPLVSLLLGVTIGYYAFKR